MTRVNDEYRHLPMPPRLRLQVEERHGGKPSSGVSPNNDDAARAVPEIASRLADMGVSVPIIGDFHYNGHLLLAKYPATAKTLAKYRINPGNVGGKRRDENFRTIIQVALDNGKPVRIGVNWGSLDQDLLTTMMDDNARGPEPLEAKEVYIEAMIESALRSSAIAEEDGPGPRSDHHFGQSLRCSGPARGLSAARFTL
jgi:(E)-4-hydroxy-3-methylbut-2-enyl-diphosphate synthase